MSGPCTCGPSAGPLLRSAAFGSGGKDTNPPGDIPDNQAFVDFSPPSAAYTVKVPEGWSQSAHGADVRFTDKLNAIELQWNTSAAPAPA